MRAGLQGVAIGQYEAARSVGLTHVQTLRLVVMPQALRSVIPSMVNLAIGIFQDTTPVLVIGMFDLLNTARAAAADPDWLGYYNEAFAFVAICYFFSCFILSRYSLWLERHLGRLYPAESILGSTMVMTSLSKGATWISRSTSIHGWPGVSSPKKNSGLVRTVNAAFTAEAQWASEHPQEAETIAQTQGKYDEKIRDTFIAQKRRYTIHPVTDRAFVTDLQKGADWLSARKVLPEKVVVADNLARLSNPLKRAAPAAPAGYTGAWSGAPALPA